MIYLVWYRQELGNFPIEPFDTLKEAEEKAHFLNEKENTDRYFVAETNYGPAIFI